MLDVNTTVAAMRTRRFPTATQIADSTEVRHAYNQIR